MATHHSHRPRHRRHDVSVAVALSRHVFFTHIIHRHFGDASEPLTNNVVDLSHRRSNRSHHNMHGDVYSKWLIGLIKSTVLASPKLNNLKNAIRHCAGQRWLLVCPVTGYNTERTKLEIESYPLHTLQIAAPQPSIAWPDLFHLALHNSLDALLHTPSIAPRHLPPNSARFSYAVSALRKVWVLIRLWKQPSAQART